MILTPSMVEVSVPAAVIPEGAVFVVPPSDEEAVLVEVYTEMRGWKHWVEDEALEAAPWGADGPLAILEGLWGRCGLCGLWKGLEGLSLGGPGAVLAGPSEWYFFCDETEACEERWVGDDDDDEREAW